jgi:hypothetical protein
MRNPWRRLRRVLADLGWLDGEQSARSRPRSALKLVAPPPPGTPDDPLRRAAQELVEAFDAYRNGWETRWDRRKRYGLGRLGFVSEFGIPLGRAREAYIVTANASSDPFHRRLAELLENRGRLFAFVFGGDAEEIRALANWVREEPRVTTQPAEWLIGEASPRTEVATAWPARSYTTTLSFEVKQTMPQPAILCIDVGTEVASARLSLAPRRDSSRRACHAIWKESRVWAIVDTPRLREGDRLAITVSSARPIAPSAPVRISRARDWRLAGAVHLVAIA